VPCGPNNTLDQVFADPQAIARGLRFDLPHALAGLVPQVATPIRYDGTPLAYDRPPPLLGEHTAAVLRARLGYDAPAIEALAQRGVVAVRQPIPRRSGSKESR
jgi:crotonobetainyl-CoA:carnitine CoA-transferase CaiB-like acyl-CoA transferase